MDEWRLPIINLDLCTGCGWCATYCPANTVDMIDAQPHLSRPEDCIYCGLCEEICPTGAISLHYEIVLAEPDSNTDVG